METFSALLAICAGNSPVPGEFTAQRPVTRSFDFFICVWINGWVNNREAGDLGRYRAHYDVIIMLYLSKFYLLMGWGHSKSIESHLRHQCLLIFNQLGTYSTLRWRHNGHDGVSNHQPHHCLLNRLFGCRSKKTSKLRVTGLVRGIHRDRWIPRTNGK